MPHQSGYRPMRMSQPPQPRLRYVNTSFVTGVYLRGHGSGKALGADGLGCRSSGMAEIWLGFGEVWWGWISSSWAAEALVGLRQPVMD